MFCLQFLLLGAYTGCVSLAVIILRNGLLMKYNEWNFVRSRIWVPVISAVSFVIMMTLQAVLTVGVSVVPLPGGTGAGEGGFRLMFAQLFLGGTLMPGMLISRGLSFYLGMILAGIVILIAMIGKSRRGLFFSCRIKHLLTASL